MENVHTAGNLVNRHFARFADSIAESERNDFFDPRNKDEWMGAFAEWLVGKIDSDHPSND